MGLPVTWSGLSNQLIGGSRFPGRGVGEEVLRSAPGLGNMLALMRLVQLQMGSALVRGRIVR